MWIGRGLWFNLGFYQHFQREYGAVFVWSMYLAIAADGYLRYGGPPLRALAARFAAFSDLIGMPGWADPWYVKEARSHRVDGVVHLVTPESRSSYFVTRALEEAGIPVLEIDANNADARDWDEAAFVASLSRVHRDAGAGDDRTRAAARRPDPRRARPGLVLRAEPRAAPARPIWWSGRSRCRTRARGVPSSVDIPAPPADPAHLDALARAGVGVATLAGNHIFDSGPNGVEDTIAALHELGIATAGRRDDDRGGPAPGGRRGGRAPGRGAQLQLRRPAGDRARPRARRAPRRSTCSPTTSSTTRARAGRRGSTRSSRPTSLEVLRSDVLALRETVDVVVVAFHKGIGHVPVVVPAYERELARTAIDCGADIVVGHHAHILRGIEVYRGKPVFHGLGNFVAVTHALTPDGDERRRARGLGEAAARALRLRARPGDAVLSLPPGEPEHDRRRLPGRRGRRRRGRVRALLDRRPRPAGPGRPDAAARRSRPTSRGSAPRPASTPASPGTASACSFRRGRRRAAASPARRPASRASPARRPARTTTVCASSSSSAIRSSGAGHRRARALVRPVAEGEVRVRRAVEHERLRVVEHLGIAVGRRQHERGHLALADRPAADLDVARRGAGEALVGRVEPQQLLERGRDQRRARRAAAPAAPGSAPGGRRRSRAAPSARRGRRSGAGAGCRRRTRPRAARRRPAPRAAR